MLEREIDLFGRYYNHECVRLLDNTSPAVRKNDSTSLEHIPVVVNRGINIAIMKVSKFNQLLNLILFLYTLRPVISAMPGLIPRIHVPCLQQIPVK